MEMLMKKTVDYANCYFEKKHILESRSKIAGVSYLLDMTCFKMLEDSIFLNI